MTVPHAPCRHRIDQRQVPRDQRRERPLRQRASAGVTPEQLIVGKRFLDDRDRVGGCHRRVIMYGRRERRTEKFTVEPVLSRNPATLTIKPRDVTCRRSVSVIPRPPSFSSRVICPIVLRTAAPVGGLIAPSTRDGGWREAVIRPVPGTVRTTSASPRRRLLPYSPSSSGKRPRLQDTASSSPRRPVLATRSPGPSRRPAAPHEPQCPCRRTASQPVRLVPARLAHKPSRRPPLVLSA